MLLSILKSIDSLDPDDVEVIYDRKGLKVRIFRANKYREQIAEIEEMNDVEVIYDRKGLKVRIFRANKYREQIAEIEEMKLKKFEIIVDQRIQFYEVLKKMMELKDAEVIEVEEWNRLVLIYYWTKFKLLNNIKCILLSKYKILLLM